MKFTGVRQVLPRAGDARHLRLAAQHTLGAHFARHSRHLVREDGEPVDHRVDHLLDLEDLAGRLHRDLARQVAVGDGRGHRRHVAQLHRQVAGQLIHVLREVAPHAGHTFHVGLASQPALCAHFLGDPGHLAGEGAQLVHHRVDGVLELEHLALDVHRDLLAQSPLATAVVTSAMLRTWSGQVARHEVHVSVRSFHVPATPRHLACPPSTPRTHLAATRVTSSAKTERPVHHRVLSPP
jgi:hypothetical protein